MTKVIDGKKLAEKIKKEIKKEVEKLKKEGITPGLAVILIGNNPASKTYVRLKEKACQETGIHFEKYLFPRISQKKLIELIQKLNKRKKINGIIVQLPLPKYLNKNKIIKAITPEKDADGFHPENLKKLLKNRPFIIPGLIQGIIKLLEYTKENLKNKKAIIMANSQVFAQPLKALLEKRGVKTRIYLKPKKKVFSSIKKADILIVALGKPKIIKRKMVKKQATVIDVGFNRIKGKPVGDVDSQKVKNWVKYISPVPGGVGPMTVVMLLKNVLELSKKQLAKN